MTKEYFLKLRLSHTRSPLKFNGIGNTLSDYFICNIYGILVWMNLLLIYYRLINQLCVRAQKKWDKWRVNLDKIQGERP